MKFTLMYALFVGLGYKEEDPAADFLAQVEAGTLTEEDINAVITGLKNHGYGDDLIADGEVGDKTRAALDAFNADWPTEEATDEDATVATE